jgi:hypothetical protein
MIVNRKSSVKKSSSKVAPKSKDKGKTKDKKKKSSKSSNIKIKKKSTTRYPTWTDEEKNKHFAIWGQKRNDKKQSKLALTLGPKVGKIPTYNINLKRGKSSINVSSVVNKIDISMKFGSGLKELKFDSPYVKVWGPAVENYLKELYVRCLKLGWPKTVEREKVNNVNTFTYFIPFLVKRVGMSSGNGISSYVYSSISTIYLWEALSH